MNIDYEKLKEEYIALCLKKRAIEETSKAAVARHNRAAKKLFRMGQDIFMNDKENAAEMLYPLLKHENNKVKCAAAMHLTALGIHEKEAVDVLIYLARHTYGMESLDAGLTLYIMEQEGRLKNDD